MDKLYYKTPKNSETGLKVQELRNEADEKQKEIEKYVKSLGAKPDWVSSDTYLWRTDLSGVEFEEEPDLKKWRVLKEYKGPEIFYVPRRGSKENIKLSDEFHSFKGIFKSRLNDCVGFGCVFRNVGFTCGNEFYYFVLASSWEHKMPEDCVEITTSEYLQATK